MTNNVSGVMFTSGARKGVAFPLNPTTGLITPPAAQPTATGYYGLRWTGFSAFRGNFPKARKISYKDGDRVKAIDWLPPTEGAEASIETSATNMDLIAMLGGQKIKALGTAKMIQVMTNKQGFEPDIALHFIQQGEDYDLGIRRWMSYLLPVAKAIFNPAGMGESEESMTFDVAPNISKRTILGTTMTEADDGTLSSQLGMMMSEGFPYICIWKGDGVVDDFLFDPAIPALNNTTAFLGLTVNGVAVTETRLTTGVTFASPPVDEDIIIALYEGAGQ
jgi:hypothetical protein